VFILILQNDVLEECPMKSGTALRARLTLTWVWKRISSLQISTGFKHALFVEGWDLGE
jgi:hypothetical protein